MASGRGWPVGPVRVSSRALADPASPSRATQRKVLRMSHTLRIEKGDKGFTAGEARGVAEFFFQPAVGQHRSIAQKIHLLRAVLTKAQRLEQLERKLDQASRQRPIRLLQDLGDLAQAHGAVAGQVVYSGGPP